MEDRKRVMSHTAHIAREVNVGPILAAFPAELLFHLAELLGNPLKLIVTRMPLLSKSCCEAARHAQRLLTCVDLHEGWQSTEDAVVAAMASRCTQLTSLNLSGCWKITDAAVTAVATGCTQLTSLNLRGCDQITDGAVTAVAPFALQVVS